MTTITEAQASDLVQAMRQLADDYDTEPREGEFTVVQFASTTGIKPAAVHKLLTRALEDGRVSRRTSRGRVFWRLCD